eukprot:scaffold190160_cov26-Tisochrysis_lutea.AAC.6
MSCAAPFANCAARFGRSEVWARVRRTCRLLRLEARADHRVDARNGIPGLEVHCPEASGDVTLVGEPVRQESVGGPRADAQVAVQCGEVDHRCGGPADRLVALGGLDPRLEGGDRLRCRVLPPHVED